ncbi:MAG: ABC transporter ATP-binding protein [Acidobacteriota bacterium]
MPLLSVMQLSRYFGGLAALSDVTFDLHKGEILGLIGPNGAGKTTLFNVINGFHQPSKGKVVFKGKNISRIRTHKICALGLARTFQVVKPLRRMTVLDNVVASAFLRAGSKAEATRKAHEILEFTGLRDDGDTLSKGLPLGKRKRLEIARALATEPELLLLDESFAGLNPTELNESIGIVGRIKERGITMMVIEHHMKVIMSISDRIIVLNYGEKIAEGTPGEIGHNPLVITAYLGETENASG